MTDTWPQFIDFSRDTGTAFITDPKSRLNEFQKHAYVQTLFMPGKEPHQFLRAGKSISSSITLKETRTYGPYDASELITFPTSNTGAVATSHWTTARAPLSWNKREVLLQSEGAWDAASRAQTFHNVYWEKMGNFMRGVANSIDEEFFAVPTTDMENVQANIPRSLWVFFNEARTSTWLSNSNGNVPVANGYWPGFTTIAQIDPTDYLIPGQANTSYWGIQQKTYARLHNASSEGFRVLGGGDLTYQMDAMLLDLQWQAAPRAEQYSFTNGDKVILSTRQGVQAIRQSLVSTSNDRWMGMAPNQTGTQITYDGKAVMRMTGMETALVYPNYAATYIGDEMTDATKRYTEGGYDSAGAQEANCVTGPRYMFVDTSDLVSFFHPDAFFSTTDPRVLFESRPDTFAMYLENWRNLHPRRLRSSGFLYPSADITGVSYTG